MNRWLPFSLGKRTISHQLIRAENRPSGFDYLRLFLAISVISIHSISICYGMEVHLEMWGGPLHPLLKFIVPSFFAMSGFLVAGSLERNTVPVFLTLRFLRIVPALSVETLVSALLLGTLLTSLSLTDYLSHAEFWRYMGSIVGWVHIYLPGVFENRSPPNYVNGSIWTMPFELECYAAIAVFGIIGLAKRPILFATVAILATLAFSAMGISSPSYGVSHGEMVLPFIFGVVIYLLRNVLPFSFPLFVLSFTLALVLFHIRAISYVEAPFVAYSTTYIGLLNPRRMLLVRGADYSYGIYIYGFPFQQVAFQLLPRGTFWLFNTAYGVLASGAAAYLSWTFVERRILDQRSAALVYVAMFMEWVRLPFRRL